MVELPYVGEVTWNHVAMVLQLVILEGLLSFDNALALAALVRTRLKNPEDQRRALTWGIWGAYLFRTLVVFIGVWLMKHEWIKAIAGIYLIWMFINEFFFKTKEEHDDENKHAFSFLKVLRMNALWKTIISVEIMDIMFSIDSIAVALAISDVKWVLIAGALLGILMMRLAATLFIKLMEKFPVLEKTAFVLVGIAGLNVILKLKDLDLGFTMLTIDRPIPEHIFMPLLFVILLGSMALNKVFPHWFSEQEKKNA